MRLATMDHRELRASPVPWALLAQPECLVFAVFPECLAFKENRVPRETREILVHKALKVFLETQVSRARWAQEADQV